MNVAQKKNYIHESGAKFLLNKNLNTREVNNDENLNKSLQAKLSSISGKVFCD